MNNKKDSDREIRVGCCQLCSIIIELGHNKARASTSKIDFHFKYSPEIAVLRKVRWGDLNRAMVSVKQAYLDHQMFLVFYLVLDVFDNMRLGLDLMLSWTCRHSNSPLHEYHLYSNECVG
jgi:hypothetical protein